MTATKYFGARRHGRTLCAHYRTDGPHAAHEPDTWWHILARHAAFPLPTARARARTSGRGWALTPALFYQNSNGRSIWYAFSPPLPYKHQQPPPSRQAVNTMNTSAKAPGERTRWRAISSPTSRISCHGLLMAAISAFLTLQNKTTISSTFVA